MIDFTKEDYMKYVEQGYISRKEHPEDSNVVILNYTEQTVFERKWNNITLACRGLILNELTGEVLARPFPKFFNYGETSGLDISIPQTQPEITVKHDGSLGIMYHLNGKIRWATRGSFVSDQAKIAQEIWDKKYSHIHKLTDKYTLLVEIIHPLTRVVVDYNGMEDLILIGAIRVSDGIDLNHRSLKWISDTCLCGMPVTDRVGGTLESILRIAKGLDHNEEGFVLCWNNPKFDQKPYRLKVKGQQYLEVHRIIYGMSLKQKVESWANGNLDGYIKSLPEEFRPEIEKTALQCEEIWENIIVDVARFYVNAEKRGRKNYALWMQKNVPNHLHGFLWLQYDNESSQMNDKIRHYIVKNYRELLGGNKIE